MDITELTTYLANTNSGLSSTVEVDDIRISVRYNPTDLVVAREVGESTSSESIQQLRAKYGQHLYFTLSLSKNGKEVMTPRSTGAGGFSELLENLSFRMGQFVTLTTSTDTLEIEDFLLNRTFGMGNSTDVLLVFNREKCRGTEWIQINLSDPGLGAGDKSFRFLMNDIDTAPRVWNLELVN